MPHFLSIVVIYLTAAMANTLDVSTATAQDLLHSRRSLMQVDFDSICGDLLSIFSNRCNCGNAQQVESGDTIDCDNGKLTAHAEFEDYKITSMEICDQEHSGTICTTIYYASAIAVHCELAFNGQQCESCFVCDANDLLGLRVSCDTVLPAITTDGCQVASTFLHLDSGTKQLSTVVGIVWACLLSSIWILM
ncbi:hypothetical protein MPSEU_001045900 [Mayamaea pseudoterrestris]|nr:hypothetical protein MPSEU_001045900 [Mayamaea pseudoterrestris]